MCVLTLTHMYVCICCLHCPVSGSSYSNTLHVYTHQCGMSIRTYYDNWSDVSQHMSLWSSRCQAGKAVGEEFSLQISEHHTSSCVNFYDVIGSPLFNIKWLEECLGCIRLAPHYLSHSCHVSQCIKKPVTQTLQKYL